MPKITSEQLPDIARGAAVLGSGGGGDPYVGLLYAKQSMRRTGPVDLVSPDDIPDDAKVFCLGSMGAPMIRTEKLVAGGELATSVRTLERELGFEADYLMAMEIGGINSMFPIAGASEMGLPLIDADGMGRAFPELQMVLPSVFGVSASPISVSDERGNSMSLVGVSNQWCERIARSVVIEMGCTAAVSLYQLTGRQVKDYAVKGTMSLAAELGRTLRGAGETHEDPVAALAQALEGQVLLSAKIVGLERRITGGFTRGRVQLQGEDGDESVLMEVEFQNENLVARIGDEVLASTPDLICLLDAETGDAVTTERLRYGVRVKVVVVGCDERWRTPEGLAIAGPAAFGFAHDYVPAATRTR